MKFRKRPVIIEAKQLTKDTIFDVIRWAHLGMPPIANSIILESENGAVVITLEGNMHATWGDWIIKGVKGEFYPCKPDIFESTYEQVTA